ncbi:pentapeptide repeat-containing protein [Fusibacter paucivorans]|uniref:Pentapeptide repeat-containing protein n=1 Tax=Fusibacter paucivorans TaxID=76009 RepID=A0ABS5PV83_9FIRM|nr:pentapeptide repeat-containing protein [Fusibacter paucivorans]MBS7528381.1 pentapeptide repeat-containing protein [Fusibacter paucivorans]
MRVYETNLNEEKFKPLQSDCLNCSGLCCVALYFSKTDGFPENKDAGKPCLYLQQDYLCKIHESLACKNMKGCIGYDCCGAGQAVTAIYKGETWKTLPEKSQEIFNVFKIIFQLHQMRWFLLEASMMTHAKILAPKINALIEENRRYCSNSPTDLISLDLKHYKKQVNGLLKEIGRMLRTHFPKQSENHAIDYMGRNFKNRSFDGFDFSMLLLIASNFSGCTFSGANFLGTDLRDCCFNGANLSETVFLTQMQVNAARGDANTQLPRFLTRPVTWR